MHSTPQRDLGLGRARPTGDRYRVAVVDPVAPGTLDGLRRRYDVQVSLHPSPPVLAELLEDADAIVLRSGVRIDGDAIAGAPSLKVIARAGAGYDNIDLDAARALGITVFNVPGGSAVAVAELAFGLAAAVSRRIAEADRLIRQGTWDKPGLVGRELRGRCAGVVGLGSIGTEIARLASAFGMTVLGTVNEPSPRRRDEWAAAGVALVDLDVLLQRSDVVFLAVPLSAATRGLLDERRIRLLHEEAVLVNVSRGGVVNEAALLEALAAGRLGGAGLDVFEREHGQSPFAALPTTVLTPHIGAMTHEAQERIGEALLVGLEAALRGDDVPNRLC